MKEIVVTKELLSKERRIAITPKAVSKYIALGYRVYIEEGLGQHLQYQNADYEKAKAEIINRKQLLEKKAIHLRVQKYSLEELSLLPEGSVHISFYDPFFDREHTSCFLEQKLTALSMQMVPRTTAAQKFDALSSQASLAGYAAVLAAAQEHSTVFSMMTTPSGTIPPAKVFVIGAGVAGLQAIATAKRLGALVCAFDTRSEVEEQVRSLGARFLQIDLGPVNKTKDGYASSLTKQQLEMQKQAMVKEAQKADIIITTAAVFGKKAPLIIDTPMLQLMKKSPSPIIVDMAAENGGNVEGSILGKTVERFGVKIIAPKNLEGNVAYDATNMYANNLYELILHCTKDGNVCFSAEDPICSSMMITNDGKILHSQFAPLQGVS